MRTQAGWNFRKGQGSSAHHSCCLLHVRVDIDENDAWRVRSHALAMGFVPGNPDLKTSLQFQRLEPYVVPKVSLTGQGTERTDTRVLQAIYSFDPAALPVYVGQQMDVFIQALPALGAITPLRSTSESVP